MNLQIRITWIGLFFMIIIGLFAIKLVKWAFLEPYPCECNCTFYFPEHAAVEEKIWKEI